MSSTLADGISQQLKCSICLEDYKSPKLLRCCHSYCKECVTQLQKRAKHNSIILCPQCRTQTEIPNGDVESLTSNFFINNILDVMERNRRTSSNESLPNTFLCVHCKSCERENTASKCKTCKISLCEWCVQSHMDDPTTKNHTIVNEKPRPTTRKISETGSLCSEHFGEKKFYCQKCEQLVCSACLTKFHSGHEHVDVKKALRTPKKMMDWLLVRCKVKMPPISEETKKIRVMEEMIERNAADTGSAIDAQFDKLIAALDKKRTDLKDEVETLKTEKLKQLASQKESMSMTMAGLTTGIEFTEQAMKEGNEGELFSMKSQICARLEELCDIKVKKCTRVWWSFYLHTPFDSNVPHDESPFLNSFRMQSDNVKADIAMVGGEESVLYNTFANQSHDFIITLKDNDGLKLTLGGQEVRVVIRVPPYEREPVKRKDPDSSEDQTGLYKDIPVRDNTDGTHSFKYKPKRQGDYFFQVTVNGKQLSGDLIWTVQGSLGFGDMASEMGHTQMYPPFGMAPSWNTVVGGKHCWKIKRTFRDEYTIVRVGVMMDLTCDKWGWCNGRREVPDPSPFALPEYLPSNIASWLEGEVLVFYSNEENGKFIIYSETSKQSEVFQRCPGTAARPYVYPSTYEVFSMDTKLERKLIN